MVVVLWRYEVAISCLKNSYIILIRLIAWPMHFVSHGKFQTMTINMNMCHKTCPDYIPLFCGLGLDLGCRGWGLDWIEQCFTSPPTQYRLYGRRFFTGQKTQPTVSKYWRRIYKGKQHKEQRKNKIHMHTHKMVDPSAASVNYQFRRRAVL